MRHAAPTLTLSLLLAALGGPAAAVTVDIDSRLSGSNVAGGPMNLLPGTTASPVNPVQLTLDAGTYTITNAATSGYFSAWNFNGIGEASGSNWVWGFVMAEHGGHIIVDAYVDGILNSQAAMAGATGVRTWNGLTQLAATSTADYQVSFTLTRRTTLDFYHDDYGWGLGDNWGGVSLNVSAVPEPSQAVLLVAGLAALGGWRRRRG